ncbi:MAG: BrnT family toxin [Proteobacteria bacterium]|jgi:uncharacterized protein|nr:BrnT family toxin [Pseudomonadota bacterium]
MDFEFDPSKSESNKEKHGIDFEEAKALWNDPHLLEIEAQTIGESRFLLIGKIADKHWSAVITYRREKIRIISVRRSRKEEVELYEEN